MKVCMCLSSHPQYLAGGSEIQMELIASHLAKKGIDVSFTSRKFGKDDQEKINGVNVGFYKVPNTPKLRVFVGFHNYFKLLNKINADIYHQRAAGSLTGITAIFSRLKKKRFVFTCASEVDYNKKLSYFPKLTRKLIDFGIKHADRVVSLSEWMQNNLWAEYHIESTLIKSGHIIPDLKFKKESPIIISWIGHLTKIKRPDLFLDLAKRFENENVRFVLVGGGEGDYGMDIINKAKLSKNVTCLGKIPAHLAEDLMEQSSLLVNTSDNEGFPNTFIQSWLRKTPVVSLNADPDCDICKNKIGFHSQSFEKLVNDVRYLIENEKERVRIGERARKYAIREHNITKTVDQHLKLYNELLEGKTR